KNVFFFEPRTDVRRVIFIGTPHRGSSLASFSGRLLDKLVRLPKRLMGTGGEFFKENTDLGTASAGDQKFQSIPTSLDLLSPGSPALELLAAKSSPPGVHYHSIIGVYHGKGKD